MIKIIYYIAALFLLIACEKDHYYYIRVDRRPLLNDGDTIVYESNLGAVYSFKIRINQGYNVKDKRYFNEYIGIFYDRLNCGTNTTPKDSMMMIYNCKNLFYYYIPSENNTSYSQALGNFYEFTEEQTYFLIGDKVYNKVFIASYYNMEHCRTYDIAALYASDNQGILRFDYKDGESFVRKNQ